MIKKLFKESYNFWFISRIILIILIIISSVSILSLGGLRNDELFFNLIGLLEGILLSIITINELSIKSNIKSLKIIGGIILILFGLTLFVILLNVSKGTRSDLYFLGFPFSIWMALIGIFDVFNIKKNVKQRDF